MAAAGSPPSKKSIKVDRELFRYWCQRWGYTPIDKEIAAIIGVTPKHAKDKIVHRGFLDKEKIQIAKAFELNIQEFIDLFYPGYFRQDGNIILDREVKYKDAQERAFDVFPWTIK